MLRSILWLTLAILTSCSAQVPGKPVLTRITDPLLRETSGLASSPGNPGFLWAINDSGADARVHLMTAEGEARGSITLKAIQNRDWEDMTSFRLEGRNYLLIADVGDNAAKRKSVKIHLIEEPDLPGRGKAIDAEVVPVRTINFRYEDGPRDCESVAVDTASSSIFLLTKRDKPPVLYQLPLEPKGHPNEAVARRLGETSKIPLPKNSLPHPHGSQPTSMDFSPDGKWAALLTYRGVFIIQRSQGESWLETFQKKATPLGAHALPQAEALGFDASGRFIYVTSEGSNPELHKWPVPADPAP